MAWFSGKVLYLDVGLDFAMANLSWWGVPHAASNTTRRELMSDAVEARLGFAPSQVRMTDAEDDQLDAVDSLTWSLAKYVRGDSAQI